MIKVKAGRFHIHTLAHSLLCRIDTLLLYISNICVSRSRYARYRILSHDIRTLPLPSCTFYCALCHLACFQYSSSGLPINFSVFLLRLLLEHRTLQMLVIWKCDCEDSLDFEYYTSFVPMLLQYRKNFDISENQIIRGKLSTNHVDLMPSFIVAK